MEGDLNAWGADTETAYRNWAAALSFRCPHGDGFQTGSKRSDPMNVVVGWSYKVPANWWEDLLNERVPAAWVGLEDEARSGAGRRLDGGYQAKSGSDQYCTKGDSVLRPTS